jgi:integrase
VLQTLRRIEDRGSIETARRVRQRMSMVFVYGISRALVRDDPAAIITKALRPPKRKGRQPAVTDLDELRDLLAAVERSPAYPVTLLGSRLIALTAVRPGVLRHARWVDMLNIDWDSKHPAPDAVWHIPADQMKLDLERKSDTAYDHVVPLSAQAVDVLRAVRRLSGRGELVFPGQRHAHKPMSENAIGYLYNRAGWHGRHVPHGWRAAFSTIMNELAERRAREAGNEEIAKLDRAVIDLMLAHVPKDKVEGAYNRARFMPRRKEIAQEWADLLFEGLPPAASLVPR